MDNFLVYSTIKNARKRSALGALPVVGSGRQGTHTIGGKGRLHVLFSGLCTGNIVFLQLVAKVFAIDPCP